jgi:RNA polymerase sigma factor FliA
MRDITIERSEEQKEKIIKDLLPFIKYTAHRLSHRLPPQLSVDDLISVGIVGLLDALRRYTEGRVKINTFVEHRIRGAMLDELRSRDWMPRSLKSKIGQIKKAHRELEQDLGRPPFEEEIAGKLRLSLDEYYRIIQDASSVVVFSFEDFRNKMHEERELDVMEHIPDRDMKNPLELMEERSIQEALAGFIEGLPENENLILSLYYWDELTMKEIGRSINRTEGRVCQLHNQALIRLKAWMSSPVC